MSITQVKVQTPANETIFTDTSITSAVDAIKASSALLYWVSIDNSANVASSYVKLYNLASGSVTVGTTAPDEIIYVPGSSVITKLFFTGANPGVTFGTALSAACVTTGGTAGTSNPSSSVILTAAYV
jgi:hypothetical protein